MPRNGPSISNVRPAPNQPGDRVFESWDGISLLFHFRRLRKKTRLTVRRDVLGRWTTQNAFDAMKIVLTIVDGIGVVVADQRLAIELCS